MEVGYPLIRSYFWSVSFALFQKGLWWSVQSLDVLSFYKINPVNNSRITLLLMISGNLIDQSPQKDKTEKARAYSRPSLGAIIPPNLVPWFLKKIFLLEKVKNDLFRGCKQTKCPFLKKKKKKNCPKCLE